MVGNFISKVQHRVNTVHQLWLCVSTKHWCYKQQTRVHLSSSSCSPAVVHRLRTLSAHQVQQLDPRWCGGDRSLWAQQSGISRYFVPFCRFPFPLIRRYPGALRASKPSWICMAFILTLFLPWVVQLLRMDGQKKPQALTVQTSTAHNPNWPALLSNDDDIISDRGRMC